MQYNEMINDDNQNDDSNVVPIIAYAKAVEWNFEVSSLKPQMYNMERWQLEQ